MVINLSFFSFSKCKGCTLGKTAYFLVFLFTILLCIVYPKTFRFFNLNSFLYRNRQIFKLGENKRLNFQSYKLTGPNFLSQLIVKTPLFLYTEKKTYVKHNISMASQIEI